MFSISVSCSWRGFDAVAPDYFDAVVFWWVMRSGDYYSAVHFVVFNGELEGWRRRHPCKENVASGRH